LSRHIRPPRHAPSRPLSLAQKRALVALVRLCEAMGSEAGAAAVSRVSGVKPNATVLALDGLARRRLAVRHDDDPPTWSPTLSGRGMARYVRAAEPRSAPVSGSAKRGE
jgi:hypothetical protein